MSKKTDPRGLVGENLGCPGQVETWKPSGTKRVVCPWSNTCRIEVGWGSSSRAKPSRGSCRAEPEARNTTEVSQSLEGWIGRSFQVVLSRLV